jgi:hypothetical protein
MNPYDLFQVSGFVRSAPTAGKLPTKEAIVEYSFTFNGKSYRGSTLTDADGYYELSILVSLSTRFYMATVLMTFIRNLD